VAFKPDRLRGMRETKGLSQQKLADVAGLSQSVVSKAENGKSAPSGDALERLACALDCTMDYIYGRGDDYEDVSRAAAHMSFQVFTRNPNVTDEQRERCRRALQHPNAPRTADSWLSLAEMMELGIGPAPSASSNLTVVRRRPR